ncbi:hypothetical protein JCM10908_003674 [Rhodotorula pacifica]|uniref:phosphatidylinositol N-acetylglucosaminyltransferase subunit C family protein n=1 Tax=Rhodotorula pacifica TaxID=1495444 RepID=UPI003180760A
MREQQYSSRWQKASRMSNGLYAEANGSATPPIKQPYRKVLFLRQPYPDNHVDASFLRDLKRNVNVHPADLPALLRQTIPITQHVASIFIFVVVFVSLSRGSLSSSTLLSMCAGLSCVCRAWSWAIGAEGGVPGRAGQYSTAPSTNAITITGRNGEVGSNSDQTSTSGFIARADTSSQVGTLIPLVALYLLSPALKTLTRATTSDSIWALSGTLFAINVFLSDYRAIPTTSAFRRDLLPRRWPFSRAGAASAASAVRNAAKVESVVPPIPPRRVFFAQRAPLPSTLSLTAALSGSTVLASRLSSNAQVFSLLLFSTLWFGPFPLLRSSLTLRPTLLVTYLLSTAALVLLFRTVGTGGTVLASAILLGTSVVAPMVRGWLYVRYKDRLSGPWDVVPPKVNGRHYPIHHHHHPPTPYPHHPAFAGKATANEHASIDASMYGRVS